MGEKRVKLVDTSAWVEYLRAGQNVVAENVESLVLSDDAAWCDMVLLELWNGARGSAEKRKLAELSAVILRLDTTAKVWELSHRLAACCRDKGQTIPATDILVAACATYHSVELEHKDNHFDIILPMAKNL